MQSRNRDTDVENKSMVTGREGGEMSWEIGIYIYANIYTVLWLVSLSCLTLGDPVDCSPAGSSVHGDAPGKKLEWVAMPSSSKYIHYYV